MCTTFRDIGMRKCVAALYSVLSGLLRSHIQHFARASKHQGCYLQLNMRCNLQRACGWWQRVQIPQTSSTERNRRVRGERQGKGIVYSFTWSCAPLSVAANQSTLRYRRLNCPPSVSISMTSTSKRWQRKRRGRSLKRWWNHFLVRGWLR